MAGIALLELMLLLLVVGLLVWAWGVSRNLPPALEERDHRLEAALAEIGRRGGRLPHLRDALKQAQQYGRDLRKLLPQLAELERFLAKLNTEGPIRDRLLVRYHELELGFAQGVAYLERLGAELLLVSGTLEPPALAELPQRLIEFREILHPTSPTRG